MERTRRTLDVLVIGGPDNVDYAASGVARVSCDYLGIERAPPFSDFDATIFWPDEAVFGLPSDPELWQRSRDQLRDADVLDVPECYWRQAGEYTLADPEIARLRSAILTRCRYHMREVLDLTEQGGLCFVVVPTTYPARAHRGLAGDAFSWFAAGLSIQASKPRPAYWIWEIGEEYGDVQSHDLFQQLGRANDVFGERIALSLTHSLMDLPREEHGRAHDFSAFYGESTWHALTWGVAPDAVSALLDRRDRDAWNREEEEWAGAQCRVCVLPGHRGTRSLRGRIKSMLFLCGRGGIAVIPQPKSVERFIDWLTPRRPAAPDGEDSPESIRGRLKGLLGPNVRRFPTLRSGLKSIPYLIDAAASTPTQTDFYRRFTDRTGQHADKDVIKKAIRRLCTRAKMPIPKPFVDELLQVINSRPKS
ncbi:MAG: hypothetical protein JXR37_00550 [Kiritimatiellae bacterium]|nr:hypothetical protein [Kiritimatiellia bacterium]